MTQSCVLTEHHGLLVEQLCAAICALTKNDADPHFLVTFHVSNFSVRLASSLLRKRQRRQSHIFLRLQFFAWSWEPGEIATAIPGCAARANTTLGSR